MEDERIIYEVVVDNEWYFEGSYEACCRIMDSFYGDEDFNGNVCMMTEEEFYGRK